MVRGLRAAGGGTGVDTATRGDWGLALLFGGAPGGFGSLGRSLRGLHVLPGLLRESLRLHALLGGAHDAPSTMTRKLSEARSITTRAGTPLRRCSAA